MFTTEFRGRFTEFYRFLLGFSCGSTSEKGVRLFYRFFFLPSFLVLFLRQVHRRARPVDVWLNSFNLFLVYFSFLLFFWGRSRRTQKEVDEREQKEKEKKATPTKRNSASYFLTYLLAYFLSFSFEKIVPKEVPTGESIKKGKGCATKWRPPPKRNKKKQNWPKKKRNSEKRKKEYTK